MIQWFNLGTMIQSDDSMIQSDDSILLFNESILWFNDSQRSRGSIDSEPAP
jgi:hypothetical protein